MFAGRLARSGWMGLVKLDQEQVELFCFGAESRQMRRRVA